VINTIKIKQSIFILLLWTNIGCQDSDPAPPSFEYQGTGWQKHHPEIILDSIPSENLYQIKVLNQKHNECSLHQERNLLFATAMLEGPPEKFLSEYRRMLDNNLLEQMAAMTVCKLEDPREKIHLPAQKPLPDKSHLIRRNPNIKKFIDDHSNFADYLPIDAQDQQAKILSYSYYTHRTDTAFDLEENVSYAVRILPLIERDRNMETNFSTDQAGLIVNIYSWLRQNDKTVELYKLSQRLNQLDNFIIPISLNLNSIGSIRHATSLIIHKKNGVLEYIFMDPLNWRVSSTENYKKVISRLIRLISNPDYVKKSLIRSGYTMLFERTDHAKDKDYGGGREFIAFPFFGYLEVLENLALLEDPFFVSYYKKPTCDLIKNKLAKPPISVELKPLTFEEDPHGTQRIKYPDAQDELWRRFKCEGLK